MNKRRNQKISGTRQGENDLPATSSVSRLIKASGLCLFLPGGFARPIP